MADSPASTSSPLAAIRDTERALEKRLREAEQRAGTLTADARARADAIRKQAESEGVKEAEDLYQVGLATAYQQADSITADGEKHARQLYETGLGRIGRAVDRIMAFVISH